MKKQNSRMKQVYTLQRNDDRGESVQTSISFIPGMPDMLVLEQGKAMADGSGTVRQKIGLTFPEAKVFGYVLNEIRNIKRIVNDLNVEEDDDD